MFKKTSLIGFGICALMLISIMVFVTGCSKGPNIKGATVIIGSWANAYDVETYVPRTEEEAMQLERRKKVLADNNMIIRYDELSGWDDYFSLVTSNILSGNKDVSIYNLGADWAMTLYKQGLLAPLNKGKVILNNREPVAMQKTAYNAMMEDLFTFNGVQHTVTPGLGGDSWQGNYLFWNKRIFREAGIDPELPYELQKAGTWTWDAFYDLARRLTIDLNNDGITDIYGMATDDIREVLYAFIYGNNANFVTIDNQGRFHNTTNRPEFIEALQFFLRLMEEGLVMGQPPSAPWDWDHTAFIEGKIAFYFAAEWRKGMLSPMIDDYGSVLPPKGPRATNYRMSNTETVFAIPAIFSQDEVDVILTAFDLWMMPVDTDWKQSHYAFYRDRRAVDETMALTKDPRNVTYRNFAMIPGFETGLLLWGLHGFTENPAQLIEQIAPTYNALIADVNR